MILNSYNEIAYTNGLDLVGQKFGLYRLEDESNSNFRERLLSVFQFKSNSALNGMRIGIARELGCIPRKIGRLEARTTEGGSWAYNCPVLTVDRNYCTIYSDYLEGDIEVKFNIRSKVPKEGEVYAPYVKDIRDWINSTSEVFNWIDGEEDSQYTPSRFLLDSNSCNPLVRSRIKQGVGTLIGSAIPSTIFSFNELITTEVESPTYITTLGQYSVSDDKTMIFTYKDNKRSLNGDISYTSIDPNFDLYAVPVDAYGLDEETLVNISKSSYSGFTDSMAIETFTPEVLEAFNLFMALDKGYWADEDAREIPNLRNARHTPTEIVSDILARHYLERNDG